MILKINNNLFIKEHNILNKKEILKIKKDCDTELKKNLCRLKGVPLYQTYSNLIPRNIKKKHWEILYKKICNYINRKVNLNKSWVNKSLSNNKFKFHSHSSDLTCVYILKNKYPEYGTKLNNDIVVEAVENSLLIFEGKIPHSIANMPKILGDKNPRYSIVMDFNYA